MKSKLGITISAGLCIVFSPSAFAYLDPGTGSALIQGVIAAVAAVGVTVKLYWHRIVGFFGSESQKDDQESESEAD